MPSHAPSNPGLRDANAPETNPVAPKMSTAIFTHRFNGLVYSTYWEECGFTGVWNGMMSHWDTRVIRVPHKDTFLQVPNSAASCREHAKMGCQWHGCVIQLQPWILPVYDWGMRLFCETFRQVATSSSGKQASHTSPRTELPLCLIPHKCPTSQRLDRRHIHISST